MHVNSTRFGEIEIREDAVISFPEGLPGLDGEQWALIASSAESPFFWLHAVDHPAVAVPVTSPWLFFTDYEVSVPEDAANALGLDDPNDAYIVCVVRASDEIRDFTINLAGPLVINAATRTGRQVINAAGGYAVRHPLFSEVELNEVQPSSAPVPVTAAAE